MATMTIKNNTQWPIHAATEWNHIVQEFQNEIAPGATAELPAAGFGWQDIRIVTGVKENRISHADDWKAALGFAGLFAAGVVTVGSVALTVATAGGAAPLTVGATTLLSATAVQAATITTVVAGGIVTLADGTSQVVDTIQLNFQPSVVNGLWGPDGYTFTVSGGDIVGAPVETGETFVVQEIKPLLIDWRNKKSGTHGRVGGTR